LCPLRATGIGSVCMLVGRSDGKAPLTARRLSS
jgi:hypothetical protein